MYRICTVSYSFCTGTVSVLAQMHCGWSCIAFQVWLPNIEWPQSWYLCTMNGSHLCWTLHGHMAFMHNSNHWVAHLFRTSGRTRSLSRRWPCRGERAWQQYLLKNLAMTVSAVNHARWCDDVAVWYHMAVMAFPYWCAAAIFLVIHTDSEDF